MGPDEGVIWHLQAFSEQSIRCSSVCLRWEKSVRLCWCLHVMELFLSQSLSITLHFIISVFLFHSKMNQTLKIQYVDV